MYKNFLEFIPLFFLLYLVVIIILSEKLNKIDNGDIIQNLSRKELEISFPSKYTTFEKCTFYIMYGSSLIFSFFFIMLIITDWKSDFFLNLSLKIESLNNICFSMTTIVITVSVVIITFKKDYYLAFSIKDVLGTQYFSAGLLFIMISCLSSQFLTVILLGIGDIDDVFGVSILVMEEVVLIINYISSIYVMFIVLRILLSEEYFELTILKQLYRKMLNLETTLYNINREWNKCATNINVAFLVQDYRKKVKRIKIEGIERFYFATSLDIGGIRWYKRAIKKLTNICVFLCVFSCVICFVYGEFYKTVINISVVFCMIFVFTTKRFMNKYYRCLNRIVYDSWGYYIKSESKEYFCGLFSFFSPRIIENYIHSIKNIVCFFRIGLEVNFQNEKEIVVIEYMLKKIVSVFKNENCKNDYIKSIYQLPIYLIGYLQYQVDIDNNSMKICKQLYKELNLNKYEKNKLNETLYGFTLDIYREINDGVTLNKKYLDYWKYLNE